MATWKSFTVKDAVNHITDHRMVLPVIQRRLVWDEEQMEKLFDTLLRQDSFGGIMVIEEEKGEKPMFECRYFSVDGTNVSSLSTMTPWSAATQIVIDGQQRLQSFYIGLRGHLNGKQLCINLGTDAAKLEFELRFAAEPAKLPTESRDDNGAISRKVWSTVPALYERLMSTNRGVKNASELRDWIAGHVTERKVYLTRHLIPPDETLWVSTEFDRFYEARQRLVIDKLHAIVAA